MAKKLKQMGKELIDTVIDKIQDKKGHDIVILDMSAVATFTDHLIICSAESTRQAQTISDHILECLKDLGVKPAHIEGYNYAKWILMDYLDFIVNIFDPETRQIYMLERLWHDAPARHIVDDK